MWNCSRCGASVEDNEKLCPVCGEEYSENAAVEEAEVVEEEVLEVAEEADDVAEEAVLNDETEDDEEAAEDDENIVRFNEPENWICEGCGTECDGEYCSACGRIKPEADAIIDFAPKKKNKIYGFVVAVSIVVAITVGIFIYFFFNRCVDKTGENNAITYADIDSAIDCIIGDETALKINGIEVPKSVFEALYATTAIIYQQELSVNELTGLEDMSKLENFKWTDIADEKTKETHQQKVIAETVNTCNRVFAIMALGEKFGVEPTQVELENVDKQIEEQKESIESSGGNFEKQLKLSGYKDVEQYKQILIMDTKYQAVLKDIENNPDRYIGEDKSIYNTEDISLVSVKPILIYFDEEEGNTEEEAKKKADEVVKKAKKGEDYDDLIDEYSENGSSSAEPLTIPKGQFSGAEDFENIEKAAFALKVDEVSKPIKVSYGYFILKRVATTSDAIAYASDNSKMIINKSLINSLKLNVSYKKIYEESR